MLHAVWGAQRPGAQQGGESWGYSVYLKPREWIVLAKKEREREKTSIRRHYIRIEKVRERVMKEAGESEENQIQEIQEN